MEEDPASTLFACMLFSHSIRGVSHDGSFQFDLESFQFPRVEGFKALTLRHRLATAALFSLDHSILPLICAGRNRCTASALLTPSSVPRMSSMSPTFFCSSFVSPLLML